MDIKVLKTKTVEQTSAANLDADIATFLATLPTEKLVSTQFFMLGAKYVCFLVYVE